MNFVPKPAPLQKRVIAGLIDAAFIWVLCGISFVVPLLVSGIVLPMWGVLGVLIGYAVVPLAAFKRTIGLGIMGLEVVGKNGHALDLANASFRELLGRGFFPFAYLFTAIASLVAAYFHVGGSITPPALAGVMTLACAAALTLSIIGHLIAPGRPDGRTLADLIAGSFVVEGPALKPPTDADEFDEWKAHRGRVTRNVVIFELVAVFAIFALPLLLASRGSETPAHRAQRIKIDALRAKFDRDPLSESLTADLQNELRLAGRDEEVRAVWEKHREALSRKEAKREEDLRVLLAQHHDRETARALINLLEQQDRVDEARDVYLDWLGEHPTPSELAGFGHWLATNNKTDEAVTVLTQATTLDPLVPYGHTLLGVSLQRLGRKPQAREELELALLDDPEDEDAQEALRVLEGELGTLTAADRAKLKRRYDAWRAAVDAGRP